MPIDVFLPLFKFVVPVLTAVHGIERQLQTNQRNGFLPRERKVLCWRRRFDREVTLASTVHSFRVLMVSGPMPNKALTKKAGTAAGILVLVNSSI